MTFTAVPAPPPEAPAPEIDPAALALGEQFRDLIWTGSNLSPRSRQASVGMSEIGSDCERSIAYKIVGTTPTNFTGDPMASLTGTGMHAALAEVFGRLDHGMGRYLIETPVMYRGVPGSADLFDRRRGLLVDWKTTAKAKLRTLRKDGPPRRYQIQIQLYAQAMIARGEQVEQVALVYIPRDGNLNDLWVWTAPVDKALADTAIDFYEDLVDRIVKADNSVAAAATRPSRLCGWCSHYRPDSTDIEVGCPGIEQLPTPRPTGA